MKASADGGGAVSEASRRHGGDDMKGSRAWLLPALAAASGLLVGACGATVADKAPAWYLQAVGYEVFVRSFQDSDGDGVGDLRGLIERLDYLNDGDPTTDDDLGVTLLWLMPITESPSYHGYDVTDYRQVDPDYGTMGDLDALVAEAHRRGIRVVVDLVANHSSSQHPWFVDAAASRTSTHRDWYVWSDEPRVWGQPWNASAGTWHDSGDAWYYGLFWAGMPDLNYGSAAVRAEMLGTARFWLDRGLDGFRLDAARYLVETGSGAGQADTEETHAFWRELRALADADYPAALFVGEVWEETSIVAPYLGSEEQPELHMVFDFDGSAGILDGLTTGVAAPARVALSKRLATYPDFGAVGTFLTNHDQERIASPLEAAGPLGLRLAAALLFGWPGTPWIYYGEEIGMRNGPSGADEDKRLPMQWSADPAAGFTTGVPWRLPRSSDGADSVAGQSGDPHSLLSLYRDLIRLRAESPALREGATRLLAGGVGSAGAPLVVERRAATQTVVLVYSFAATESVVVLPAAALGDATTFTDLLSGASVIRAGVAEDLHLGTLPAFGFTYLEAR